MKDTQEKWVKELKDDFYVMFKRATKDNEPVDWREKLEDFIKNLLKEEKQIETLVLQKVSEAEESVLKELPEPYHEEHLGSTDVTPNEMYHRGFNGCLSIVKQIIKFKRK